LRRPYWSAATSTPRSEPFLIADGGDEENIEFIGLLRRRVQRIVLFFNSEQVLT
jgi:hypothetical protein